MNKRKRNEDDSGDETKLPCGSSTDNKNGSLFGSNYCPKRDYMFSLLQQGNVKKFKKLAPMFALHLDTDSNQNTFMHRVVLMCSKTGYASIKNILDLMLKEAPGVVSIRNQKTGATPLMLACQEARCLQLILRLVEAKPKTVRYQDRYKDIPLLKFISNVKVGQKGGQEMKLEECCKVIQTLLEPGKNVNHVNSEGKSALKCLNERQDLDIETFKAIATILFQHGAKLVDKYGEHAFLYVTKFQSTLVEIVSEHCPKELSEKDNSQNAVVEHLLLDEIDHESSNSETTYRGNMKSQPNYMQCNDKELLESLKIIFKNTETIENGYKLITLAANRNCDFKIIKFLMSKTSSLNLEEKDNLDKLIIHYSTTSENVTELLKFGCNANAITHDSDLHELTHIYKFPLCTASNIRNSDAIMKLIEGGANPLIIIKTMHSWPQSDKFAEFITEDQAVLKYVLDSPHLTKTTENCELLTQFFMLLVVQIFLHFNTEANVKVTREKLELIFNKIQIENVDLIVQIQSHFNVDLNSEIFGHFFKSLGNIYYNPISDTHVLERVHNFIKLMLDIGFKILKSAENMESPLKEFLILCDEKESEIVLQFTDLLIVKGEVNVESNALTKLNHFPSYINYLNADTTLLIPDALTVAINLHHVDVVEKLLPYWWGPPIALTALLNKLVCHGDIGNARVQYLRTDMYQLLLKYGEKPNGTTLLPKSVRNEMENWKMRCNKLGLGQQDGIPEASDLASPASLQELSKYVVRHSLAARALQPDVSLPQLLHQVLPPLLRSVVIH